MNFSELHETSEKLTTDQPHLKPVIKPFLDVLKFVVEEPYRGACHATSSVLYVLLSELNIEARICIGELGRDEMFFDHSWIEIDGKVFDVSVARPLDPRFDGSPVYMSRDLETLGDPHWQYGTSSGIGNDPFVQTIKAGSFASFMDDAPFHKHGLWHFVQKFGRRCGLEINLNKTRQKYAHVKWTVK
jgi:hypothetical protein